MNIPIRTQHVEEISLVGMTLHSLMGDVQNLGDFARDPHYRDELIKNYPKIVAIHHDLIAAIESLWRINK